MKKNADIMISMNYLHNELDLPTFWSSYTQFNSFYFEDLSVLNSYDFHEISLNFAFYQKTKGEQAL